MRWLHPGLHWQTALLSTRISQVWFTVKDDSRLGSGLDSATTPVWPEHVSTLFVPNEGVS